MQKLRHLRKASSVIDLKVALDILGQDLIPTLVQNATFGRGLPPRDFLKRNLKVANVLQDVLLNGSVTGVWGPKQGRLHQTDGAVNACYHRGWVQAELAPTERDEDYDLEKTIFIFPSDLHKRYVLFFPGYST